MAGGAGAVAEMRVSEGGFSKRWDHVSAGAEW